MVKAKVRFNDAEQGFDFSGFSTDEKPTGKWEGQDIPQMSSFLELDTSKRFLYSEQDQKWYRDYTSSGSGGSGGSGGSTPDDPTDDVGVATDDEVQNIIDDIWKDTGAQNPGTGTVSDGSGDDNIASDDEVNGVVDDIWSDTP
ncbi:MAG: hypothetical protein IJT16_08045 [Lachnospiraceae bacterium]|nr:hypothetical protein [Lachnospiraceae bacterium]